MTISEILRRVENVNPKTKYWFVRTDYGEFFERFLEGGFIAIGWDYISLFEINNSKEETVKNKIAKEEDLDQKEFKGKIGVTSTYNKIKAFISLKKGDIVIIPSRNSERLAFGHIVDEKAYEDTKSKEYHKQRKVEWHTVKYMDDLSPIFYQVKSNQHTISNIDGYASHIDRVIGSLFKKGDNTHYVLNIEQSEDINFVDLNTLMDNIKILINNINAKFEFNENFDNFYIKVNLQSKGAVELIKSGKSLAVLAYLMFLVSCNELDDERDPQIKGIIDENRQVLKSTSSVIDTMKMNTTEMTHPFKNGK